MGQHEWSGGALIDTRRASQRDETFKPLEGKLDPPAKPVESESIGCGERLLRERGNQDHPIASDERTVRYLITAFAGGQTRFASGLSRRLRRLFDGDQAHFQRGFGFTCDPNQAINQPAFRCLAKLLENIDGVALRIEPSRSPPASSQQNVAPRIENIRDTIRLQIGPVTHPNFTFNDRSTVERFTAGLIRQLEKAKAFTGQVEGSMHAPQFILRPGCRPCFRYGSSIYNSDQTTVGSCGRGRGQHLANQLRQPVSAIA